MAKTPKLPMVDHNLIRELTKLLDETGVTRIEIERQGQRVRVARSAIAAAPTPRAAPASAPAAAPQAVAESIVAPLDLSKHPGVVTSPMVGTAYVAPEPGAQPFVEVGR